MNPHWLSDTKFERNLQSKELSDLIASSESRLRSYAAAKTVRTRLSPPLLPCLLLNHYIVSLLSLVHQLCCSVGGTGLFSCFNRLASAVQLVQLDDHNAGASSTLNKAEKLLEESRARRLKDLEKWAKQLGALRPQPVAEGQSVPASSAEYVVSEPTVPAVVETGENSAAELIDVVNVVANRRK